MPFKTIDDIGDRVSVPIDVDVDGYLGRECPNEECLGYFKVTPGTGLNSVGTCICPYCGHKGKNDTFHTQDQIEYAKSVVFRQLADLLHDSLKSLEFDHRPTGGMGIGVSMKVTRGARAPILHYREKDLETAIVCDECELRYTIYGVFGWCPDCGEHNSVQILNKNLELARKELALSTATDDKELADHLLGDALENVVSAFDGFGREICSQHGEDIHFQNLTGARRKVQEKFGIDLAEGLASDEWASVCRVFQKRHLLAHKMGVADDDYVSRADDADAVIGRKIKVSSDEVQSSTNLVATMGRKLYEGLAGLRLSQSSSAP